MAAVFAVHTAMRYWNVPHLFLSAIQLLFVVLLWKLAALSRLNPASVRRPLVLLLVSQGFMTVASWMMGATLPALVSAALGLLLLGAWLPLSGALRAPE